MYRLRMSTPDRRLQLHPHCSLLFLLLLTLGLPAVLQRGHHRVPGLVLILTSPRLTGYWALPIGCGSRMPRSQSTVRLTPSARFVSGCQPSARPARVGSNALA